MEWLILLTIMAVLFLIGMPLFYVMGLTAFSLLIFGDFSLINIPIRMFSGINSFILLAVPMFILAGEVMNQAGISRRLMDHASSLVGFMRGGLAHVNIVTSMFFAEMSGSGSADAGALGKVFIPAMEAKGYPRNFSAAVTSASATIGIIIPPSVPMLMYAVLAEVSVAKMFIGGLIPGVIMGTVQIIFSYIFALKNNYPVEEQFSLMRVATTFRRAFLSLFIPVLILGGIFGGIVTPTEASVLAVFSSFILGFAIYREIRLEHIKPIVINSAKQSAAVMVIVSSTSILSWYMANQQMPQKIAEYIFSLGLGRWAFLLALNGFFLMIGCLMSSAPAIVLTVPIVMPLIHKMGIDPIHFGLILTVNLGIGQQTPPVATVLLTTCSVANISMWEVLRIHKYYILAMAIVLMIITYVPELTLFLPGLIKE
jgi:tripartite ATP-independent transporter DctM subunit